MLIEDRGGMGMNDLGCKCGRVKEEEGVDMIVIDYVELIEGRG
ncbi:DnaB-like helicase C-terminal domain-containing protein [Staphylococcus epidermidis]|nr:DnaB-like helicase C-terminal domain-containing protein [Staphylococcus epidermidis]